jgi:putative NIF3 family GTP cyclohydrolase 1 type 2
MNIKEIFKLAIELGIKNDFRNKAEINDHLSRKKEEYQKLPKDEKPYFDQEKLSNPYADSGIQNENGSKKIRKILAGIDVSVGSIALAEEVHADLIINHHPIGKTLANLDEVMHYQIDQMEKIGIPVNIAEKLIHKRISEVARGINPINHFAVVDAARILKVNLMNVHTPADNLVAKYVETAINKSNARYVKDIMKVLLNIPEYQEAKKMGFGPMLFSGAENNRTGKIVVSEMTGGTEGSKEIYQAMANAGVGTIVGMHQSEEHRKAAEDAHINVIVAGHISSDSLGMNLFLDELEKKGMEIIPFGGLIRVKRFKKKS